MSVLVRIGNKKAFLRAGRWMCADAETEKHLNETTAAWIAATGGPPLGDRDQEHTVARHVASQIGGRVLLHLKSTTGASEKYFYRQRQMKLDFDAAIPLTRRKASA
ncbi:MAG: hypothetical protein JJE04_18625 [Acidobacteriia bacterium]|nr:hypothetical protein [Terriglobia bacterium]